MAKKDEKQAIGRSVGGLSTKIHATCDALGNSTSFHLTEGQEHDLKGADALMERLMKADAVLSDKSTMLMSECAINSKKMPN